MKSTNYYNSACKKMDKKEYKKMAIEINKSTNSVYNYDIRTEIIKKYINPNWESDNETKIDKNKDALVCLNNYLKKKILEKEPNFDYNKLIEDAKNGIYTKKRKRKSKSKNVDSFNTTFRDLNDEENENLNFDENRLTDNSLDLSKTIKKDSNKKKKQKKTKRTKICEKKKEMLLIEQNFCCRGPSENDKTKYVCVLKRRGQSGSLKTEWGFEQYDVDHILELENFGTNDYSNLQILCKACHTHKTSMAKMFKKDKSLEKKYMNTYQLFCKPKF